VIFVFDDETINGKVVSSTKNIWPPNRLPELPKEIAALVLGARLFLGSTFSAT
jgi:hypothetical protein